MFLQTCIVFQTCINLEILACLQARARDSTQLQPAIKSRCAISKNAEKRLCTALLLQHEKPFSSLLARRVSRNSVYCLWMATFGTIPGKKERLSAEKTLSSCSRSVDTRFPSHYHQEDGGSELSYNYKECEFSYCYKQRIISICSKGPSHQNE